MWEGKKIGERLCDEGMVGVGRGRVVLDRNGHDGLVGGKEVGWELPWFL